MLLTTVRIYRFTRSGATVASSCRRRHSGLDWVAPLGVPQGWAMFKPVSQLRLPTISNRHVDIRSWHFACVNIRAPLMIVGEGTNEIQRHIIARQLISRNRID